MTPRRWVVALSLWNLFVWGGRLRNLFNDTGGDLGQASRWSLAASVAFVVVALACLVSRSPKPAVIMAVAGIAVWTFRGLSIAFADHSAAFIAVHSVLALVTIGLGAVVLVTLSRWVSQ